MATSVFDLEGRERRTEAMGVTVCVVCGEDVPLVAETEGWILGDDKRWHHTDYGPAMGICCNTMYADWWEGCFAFPLAVTPGAPDREVKP